MEDELIHELSAAYALDALDPDEERAFEAHLATCAICQKNVAAFSSTAVSLAYATPPATLSSELRARVLSAARAERTNVVSMRGRAYQRGVASLSAVATAAAIGLGVWVATTHSHSGLHTLSLRGASGSVVVAANGEATLVVSGLDPAPVGKTYEAWVIKGTHATPAGLFAMRRGTGTLVLSRRVPHGATVAVTLEHAGGALQPSGRPLLMSSRA